MDIVKKGEGKLTKKPLAEAIFELRWELPHHQNGLSIDPYYKILIGSFYEKIKDQYPIPESLPSSSMPEEFSAYIVQQRFRREKDGWPLVQIGPGILTYNQTTEYDWSLFQNDVKSVVENFGKVYPNRESLTIKSLRLRYLNAFDFKHNENNVFTFLKSKLKTQIELPPTIFTASNVTNNPKTYNLSLTFPANEPNGEIMTRFAHGTSKGKEALIWELSFSSSHEKMPNSPDAINEWLHKSHTVIDIWFYGLTNGDLFKSFI